MGGLPAASFEERTRPRISRLLRIVVLPRQDYRILPRTYDLIPYRAIPCRGAPSDYDARCRPRLCENARASFLRVNFSHVDAISGDLSPAIRLLPILRGEQKEFSHSLGHKRPVRLRLAGPIQVRFPPALQTSRCARRHGKRGPGLSSSVGRVPRSPDCCHHR